MIEESKNHQLKRLMHHCIVKNARKSGFIKCQKVVLELDKVIDQIIPHNAGEVK